MEQEDSYYTVLQCPTVASLDELRAKYMILSKLYHPDKPSGSSAAFAKLADAWRVLSNATSRALYDAELQGLARPILNHVCSYQA